MPFIGDEWANGDLSRALFWGEKHSMEREIMREFRLMAAEIVALKAEVKRLKEILDLVPYP